MLNELIQTNQMVIMKFWYIEHKGARFGDNIDAKNNYFKQYQMFFQCILIINRRMDA